MSEQNRNINYSAIFNATIGIFLLWIISGFKKLSMYAHYGISVKLLSFDIIDSFLPMLYLFSKCILIIAIPYFIIFKIGPKNKIVLFVVKLLISLVAGTLLFSWFIFNVLYTNLNDRINITALAWISLILFIITVSLYYFTLSLKRNLTESEAETSFYDDIKFISAFILAIILIFFILDNLFLYSQESGDFDIVTDGNLSYIVIDRIDSDLIVMEYSTDDIDDKVNCVIQYSKYKIIPLSNTEFYRAKFNTVIVSK